MTRAHYRHRQRGQMTVLALYAAIVLTGAVALVVDAGVFFVTQRQLQTAVDAAALAAVWYAPVCTSLGSTDCRVSAPTLPTAPAGWTCTTTADCVANAVLQENLGFTGALCRDLAPVPNGRTDAVSGLSYYIMTVNCDAPFWFARVFPNINATMHLTVFARATIGYPTPTGVTNIPNANPIVSRLVT